jgi:hypothetical protein
LGVIADGFVMGLASAANDDVEMRRMARKRHFMFGTL